jgi:hypothetical protein
MAEATTRVAYILTFGKLFRDCGEWFYAHKEVIKVILQKG